MRFFNGMKWINAKKITLTVNANVISHICVCRRFFFCRHHRRRRHRLFTCDATTSPFAQINLFFTWVYSERPDCTFMCMCVILQCMHASYIHTRETIESADANISAGCYELLLLLRDISIINCIGTCFFSLTWRQTANVIKNTLKAKERRKKASRLNNIPNNDWKKKLILKLSTLSLFDLFGTCIQ